MNNFNKLFLAIKEIVDDDGVMCGGNILELLSERSKIPLSNIVFYLNTLENAIVIKYYHRDCLIRLTEAGRNMDTLFMA